MTSQPSARDAPMGSEPDQDGSGRHQRADARRNHERLVAAARRVFAAQDGDASMEAIAREAAVGVGTLYRHFPRRIDVVEAVYRDDIDEVVRSAEDVVARLDPWPAVAEFLRAYVGYARRKRTLLNELREAFEKNPDLKLRSRERLEQAMGLVVDRAQGAGAMRDDVRPEDLAQLLGPMCTNPSLSDEQVDRLLPLILDGLRVQGRPGAPSTPR